MAVIWIPSLLQALTEGHETVTVAGANMREVLHHLMERYPAIGDRLLRDDEQLQEGIAIAVNGEIPILGMLEPIGESAEVHILPAIGGGAREGATVGSRKS